MKIVVEYLEQARVCEHLAHETTDAEVKARILEHAKAYRKLADERAVRFKITTPQAGRTVEGARPLHVAGLERVDAAASCGVEPTAY